MSFKRAIGFLDDPVTPDSRRRIENFLDNRRRENPIGSAQAQFILTSIDALEDREAARRGLQGGPGHIGDSVANQQEGRIG